MSKDNIKSRTIYNNQGKQIGSIVGRKEDVDRFSNHDLSKKLEIDRKKQRENLDRK